ncbi:MAG: serine hydrolase domain-containing protein [Gemmatimonadaceae bacterium]
MRELRVKVVLFASTFSRLLMLAVGLAIPTACQRATAVRQARPSPAPLKEQVAGRIDSAIARAMRERDIPGASLAVLCGDGVVLLRGYGTADRERGTLVTPETIFQIASLTKPFTAMAILLLVEAGTVDLDAPADRYLGWLPGRYGAVTVRQLLQHTSGVAPDVRRANVDEMSESEFRQRFLDSPASFPPGTRWQYANTGYTLLSQIVERVSGEPFGQFLERRIFAPLAMRSTGYRVPEQSDARHAVGYDLVDGVLRRAPHVFSGWGNSGIETTAADLARWASAIHRGALLPASSYRIMFSPGRLAADTVLNFPFRDGRAAYGFGWFLMRYQGEPLISHGGAIAGFSSVLDRLPTRGWTVLVLSNGKQGVDRQGQAEAIAGVVLGELNTAGSECAREPSA